jgi:omega-amidase
MRITLAQYAPLWEDRAATRSMLGSVLNGVGDTDWLVFPEMALSGFSMDITKTTWDENDWAFFAGIARSHSCFVTAGGVEGGKNKAFTFDSHGNLLATYEKRHLFSYSKEGEHYSPGNYTTQYAIGDLKVGQSICYDLRFPYQFWHSAPEVDCFCVIAAWGGKRAEQWKILLRARAIENQAFVVAVNRIGNEPGGSYSGDSAVIDPRGTILLDCGDAEGFFPVDIDQGAVAAWRSEFPALKDRLA